MTSAFIVRGDDGEDYGPVGLGELRQWVRENRAGLGTVVRTDEPGSLWQPWQYYPELVALLAEAKAVANPMAGSVLAPLGRRGLAFVLDLVLIYILLCPIFLIIYVVYLPDVVAQVVAAVSQGKYPEPQLSSGYEALFNFIVYGVVALYMAGFHAAHGKTPAKALFRLQVVDQNGDKPGVAKALARGLVLSFSLCLFFFPLLYVFFNPQRRAFHDLAAGTFVVEN